MSERRRERGRGVGELSGTRAGSQSRLVYQTPLIVLPSTVLTDVAVVNDT
ncbi:hypothetical protein STRIP9103_02155 [Streptomyces ipomoeae 91-03]|uniref:Uncharacterized protein n=1 Tax=Streptomyces ipomoeae 91-03 TaxID=698759 RepID=L1L0G0_9ACTN|nr:hypothetical protein STRIP9103_02155 [Streptomyces ipomoeae 91-03]